MAKELARRCDDGERIGVARARQCRCPGLLRVPYTSLVPPCRFTARINLPDNRASSRGWQSMKSINGWSVAAPFEGVFSNVTRSYVGEVRYAW